MRALLVASILLASTPALAAAPADCPPGSTPREEDGFGWCQPTVCQTDEQCGGGHVCRPVAFCLQVGSVGKGDGGQRLVVTQRCAPDKTCPQTTTCSDLGRCLSKDVAAKMGVLEKPAHAAPAAPPSKSSCGCEAVGTGAALPGLGLGLAALASAALLRRRRR